MKSDPGIMKQDVDFEENALNVIKEVQNSELPLIVFGTMTMGQIACNTFIHFNKTNIYFCDNDSNQHRKVINGIEVLSFETIKKQFKDAYFYIASFQQSNVESIQTQLLNAGYDKIIDQSMIFYVYQTIIHNRKIDSAVLSTYLNYKIGDEGSCLENVFVILTEKCSLKCKDCGALITHFKHPKHYEKERIITSMKRLSKSVDGIRNLVLFGGEPFIHPEFVDICKAAAEIDNALMVSVITNGTIIPTNEVLQQLHALGICVQISDYGVLSKDRDMLEKILIEKQIVCEVVPQTAAWYPVSVPENHHRSRQERIDLFEKCVFSKKCPQLQNGEFHICGYSAAGSALNLIPKNGSGYIDLLDKNFSTDEIRKKINYLLIEVDEITACGYCGFDFTSTTVRAAQLREK